MKKLILSLTTLFLLLSTSTFADSCSIPKFIKIDAKIKYQAQMRNQSLTIVKIDTKACWVKGDNGMWINLNAIPWIIPAGN